MLIVFYESLGCALFKGNGLKERGVALKLFRWKGFRIRKRHKGAPARFIFYLMLPVLAVTGFLEQLMISQGETSPIILGSTMFCGFVLSVMVAYLLLYFPLYNYYKRLLHKRKLAKMIISRRLFVEVAKSGKNARGKKTVYFPKIFYQHKKG
ncbi:MAG: hypothetical protein RR812_01830, partial [Vagococcus sp.]